MRRAVTSASYSPFRCPAPAPLHTHSYFYSFNLVRVKLPDLTVRRMWCEDPGQNTQIAYYASKFVPGRTVVPAMLTQCGGGCPGR